MPTFGCNNFAARAARRKALVAKWTAKYKAQGLPPREIERAIGKRLSRCRV